MRRFPAGGSSIVTVCPVPSSRSLGCSFARALRAAHRRENSLVQPQEQVTTHGAAIRALLNPPIRA